MADSYSVGKKKRINKKKKKVGSQIIQISNVQYDANFQVAVSGYILDAKST